MTRSAKQPNTAKVATCRLRMRSRVTARVAGLTTAARNERCRATRRGLERASGARDRGCAVSGSITECRPGYRSRPRVAERERRSRRRARWRDKLSRHTWRGRAMKRTALAVSHGGVVENGEIARGEEEFLTTGDAAVLCGVSRSTLRRAVAQGQLRAWHTPGKHLRFSRADRK